MPCCAGSACDECARNGIIESESSKCPVCGEVANPEELIPYRLFRDKVDRFRNQTGYTAPRAPPPASIPQPPQQSLPLKPTLPDIVLPDPTDKNFVFDSLAGLRAAPGTKVEPPDLNFTINTSVPPPVQTPATPVIETPKTPGTPGTPTADSPVYEMLGPSRIKSPHTPTSTPPRSPSTPRSTRSRTRSPSRDRSVSRERRSPVPVARKSPPPPAPRPVIDTSVPPPMAPMISSASAPSMTLLPPGHVLSQPPPQTHYPPPVAPPPPVRPSIYAPVPAVINPSEDPLAAFEAAMRKLDSKKARGRSPPRAYQDRPRSRSRERYRDYYDGYRRDYSPRRRSPPPGYYSPPRRDRGYRRSPPPPAGGEPRRRFVEDIPPETEQERRDRERYEREFAERERRKKEDGYDIPAEKVRIAPTPPREFLERENGDHRENRSPKENRTPRENRTPSLSPDPRKKAPDVLENKENIDTEVNNPPTKLPIIRDERDLDDDVVKNRDSERDKERYDEK